MARRPCLPPECGFSNSPASICREIRGGRIFLPPDRPAALVFSPPPSLDDPFGEGGRLSLLARARIWRTCRRPVAQSAQSRQIWSQRAVGGDAPSPCSVTTRSRRLSCYDRPYPRCESGATRPRLRPDADQRRRSRDRPRRSRPDRRRLISTKARALAADAGAACLPSTRAYRSAERVRASSRREGYGCSMRSGQCRQPELELFENMASPPRGLVESALDIAHRETVFRDYKGR